jgi:hypothetical protein
MIESEQGFFCKRCNKLYSEKRVAGDLIVDQLCQWSDPIRFAVKSIRNQLPKICKGQGCKGDFLHNRSSLADRFELAHQRMAGINFVVPVGANQHQVSHIRLGQEILEQIERCRVKPLQVVEEESKRMLRSCEYAEESPEDQLEAALRVLRRKLRDW